jgi:predicted TIM-barrel fold metal-dependent hydrolase
MVRHGVSEAGGFEVPDWSPEQAIDFMDRYGIAAQVLGLSDPGVSFAQGAEARQLARGINEYTAGLIRKYPKRFGGHAVLPMPDVAASIAELEYALDTLVLDGVVLLTNYGDVLLADQRFEPLFAALHRRKAYVFVHPATIPDDDKPDTGLIDALLEFPFATTRFAAMMMKSGALRRWPGIRWQLSHAGGAFPYLMTRIAGSQGKGVTDQLLPEGKVRDLLYEITPQTATKGLYYDTALSSVPSAMLPLRRVVPLERIVFGSDWPFGGWLYPKKGDPQPELSLTFSDAERAAIERANALRQFPRLAARLA